jgi:N-acetylmuramoyl-L-alanine amidase
MNQLFYYLLQVMTASALLYGYYYLALRNKKFHSYNRFYLLAAIIISILIPFLNIPVYFTAKETETSFVLQTLTVISSPAAETSVIPSTASETVQTARLPLSNILCIFYSLAALIVLIRIIFSLKRIRSIARNNPVEKLEKINFVSTDEPGTPFSFFRWLFWNRRIELKSEKGEHIFRHELYHIQQKHSWDILFMELLTVVFWLNPFFHLMKKELKAIHEFLADEFAVNENEKWEYAELLLMQVLNTRNQLVNPFFHNQIKRRIAMITSSQKSGNRYLRKLLVLPVAAFLVIIFAFNYKNNKINEPVIKADDLVTIVVDAGHGGTDKGAISPDGKYSEALLTLELAKTIQRLAPDYNVNVIMTREDETFPAGAATRSDGLRKRIEILNQTMPDAIISIHLGMSPSNMQSNLTGFEAYISKSRNNERNKLLAAAILLELKTVYQARMEIKQTQNQGIFILDKADFPAVLLECGFLNNPKDIAFITDKSNQEEVARSILKGLVAFSNAKIKETGNSIAVDTVRPEKINFKEVLVVIDGVIRPKKGIDNLDSNLFFSDKTDYVSILTGKAAAEKYGEKGKHGVFEVYSINKSKERKAKEAISEIKQDTIVKPKPDNSNIIFEKIEIEPAFPGGEKEWRKYLERNLDVLAPLKKGCPSGTYAVVIQFIVDKDGALSDIKPLTSHGYSMEEQVTNVIKKGPKWVPGRQNGHIVKAYKRQTITFVIAEDDIPGQNNSITVSGSDKMNRLFIGIDNHLTITSSEAKNEDLIVNSSHGKITGKDGKYIIRVTQECDVVISVSIKGKNKPAEGFQFRSATIPDPPRIYFFNPDEGQIIKLENLRFAKGLKVENSEVDYEISSFRITLDNDKDLLKEIVNTGSVFNDQVQSLIAALDSKTYITIEDIFLKSGQLLIKAQPKNYTLIKE